MVILGSRFLVNSSLVIAEFLGFSTLFIGLTVVALGTSLPELATALASVRKGVVDLSLGNVVGANILGITWVAGLAGTIEPFSLESRADLLSLLPMLIFIILLLVVGFTQSRISRREGAVLFAFYLLYIFGAYRAGIILG